MKKSLTEIVFILDKSGSMGGLETDTIGGYNAMLKKQQKIAGEAVVTTVLFDDGYELLHDRINIKGIRPLTDKDYEVGGTTALFDAIGRTIHKIGNAQKHTLEEERAENVLFVITTDGYENSSCEYNSHQIKKMIEHQKAKYGWQFIFLGANIDAIGTAATFGIDKEFAVQYEADSEGTRANFEAIEESITYLRENKSMNLDWKKKIEARNRR